MVPSVAESPSVQCPDRMSPDDPRHAAASFLAVLIEERDQVARDLAVLRRAAQTASGTTHPHPGLPCGVYEREAELVYLDRLIDQLRSTISPAILRGLSVP